VVEVGTDVPDITIMVFENVGGVGWRSSIGVLPAEALVDTGVGYSYVTGGY